MSGIDDFFEVNNEVPFKPIKEIKIDSLELTEDIVKIRASMVLQGDSEAEFIEINRTEKDVYWLLENLGNSGKLPLLPSINCENTLAHLVSLISGSQPAKAIKLKRLKEKVLLRCLTLISTICLHHLSQVNASLQTPIFIFFHENFALYQNPIYFKQEKVALSAKVTNFFWHKYAMFTRKTHWQELQKVKAKLQQERDRLKQVTSSLHDYLAMLVKLQQEFISEKDCIKKRTARIQEIYLSFEMHLRYLDLVLQEEKETQVRAEQDKVQSEQLISAYGSHLQQERIKAVEENKQLMKEYVKVICQEEDKLRIAPQ